MTEHELWRDELAYYHGLPPLERRALDAHLAGCAECRATLSAYEVQDTALDGAGAIRPAQAAWQPVMADRSRPWRPLLGDALALTGAATLIWMLALQARFAGRLNAIGGTGVPAGFSPEPGIAIPPAYVTPPSAWLPALPWIGLALISIGLLFILSWRRRWPAALGSLLAVTLLASYVPPLSTLPNPAGLFWRLVGGYSYDPDLPFKNDFLIAGRPEQTIKPYLDSLIGAVGLSPLDPAQPLVRYEILRVGLHPQHNWVVLVTTRFFYADGSSRIYPVPLTNPAADFFGFWQAGWRSDGLERLRSQHLALPGQPFAGSDASLALGPAQRLGSLSPAANRLDEVNPAHWLWGSVRLQHLVWAPNGQSFLAAMEIAPGRRKLWAVPLDGSAPRLLAGGDIREYGWSPDGGTVVLTLFDQAAAALDSIRPYAIQVVLPNAAAQKAVPLVTALATDQLPGLAADGVRFFADGNLWVVPYAGGQPRLSHGSLAAEQPQGQPRVAADGQHVAFACKYGLCLLANLPGQSATVVHVTGLRPAEITWSPDGSRIAVVDRDPNRTTPVRLLVVTSQGDSVLQVPIAPEDVAEAPQWLPDGQAILVQTYPYQGRRIIAVDLPLRRVVDLSQQHWDAYFALSPDGRTVLLNNGRGDFWTAPVIRRP